MAKRTIKRRLRPAPATDWPAEVHPIIRRLYEARGIRSVAEIELRLSRLLNPALLGGIDKAVDLLIDAIVNDKLITVAGDYDCDGATGTAVAVRGLKLLGAKKVNFVIPDRFLHGYGLSPGLVESMSPQPDLILTVDSGTSSFDGVACAKAKGITVVVTDHHLPAEGLPIADAIVNPNLKGETFPSKMLAGVGVMFYTLVAMRSEMRKRSIFLDAGPDITSLLDLVALGTVADLVPLDHNNRILVDAGLRRIRAGKANAGINALVAAAQKNIDSVIASDIAFTIAPRLNAAGRLENMTVGVQALTTDDAWDAQELVSQLDAINKERKEKQASMVSEAESMVGEMTTDSTGVVVYDPKWHAGIVGLVASKLKESLHRPVVALAAGAHADLVHGSARSIEGFHLRDALALIDVRHPGMLVKFGGHAMAAGMTLKTVDIPAFTEAFDKVAAELLTDDHLQALAMTDGELPPGFVNIQTAYLIREAGPWGQAFPEPVFDGVFDVVTWKLLGEKHLRLQLQDPRDMSIVDAIMFFASEFIPPPPRIHAAYQLTISEWQGRESLKLLLQYMEPCHANV